MRNTRPTEDPAERELNFIKGLQIYVMNYQKLDVIIFYILQD